MVAMAARVLSIAPDDPACLYNVACLHACMGEPDRALAYLELALGKGFGGEWTRTDPDLVSLRDDPRFEALLAHVAGASS